MPLHNVIPLCDFRYVGDIYSGATFSYDAMGKIQKNEARNVEYVDRVIEIDKISKRIMYKEIPQIEKVASNKRMYSEIPQIDKSMVKRLLVAQTKEINIEHSRDYERESAKMDKVMISMELEPPQRELNKSKFQELESIMRGIDITTSKLVEGVTPLLMGYSQDKILKISELTGLNKCISLNLNCDSSDRVNIDKSQDITLGSDVSINLNKNDTLSMSKDTIMELPYYKHDSLIEVVCDSEIQCASVHRVDRINEKEIITDNSIMRIDRLDIHDISREDALRHFTDLTLVNIGYDESKRLVHRDVITEIDQHKGAAGLTRINEKYIDKDKGKRLFYASKIKYIDVINFNNYLTPIKTVPIFKFGENYLDRLNHTDLFKLSENYMDRLHTTDVFKIQDKYVNRIYVKDMFKLNSKGLNYASITSIYKERQKSIIHSTIKDIYKNHSISIIAPSTKDIYLPRENKFIEVTKRWWWLNEISPSDHLILPNRDYGGMIDLLGNENYEYLRYTNHPIDWGKSWGIDHNIPPAAISIEIMLDLTNIVRMILHKSEQGWANVSGKEAIQMLMELLYDWFNMSTSDLNYSYYRAYRWVRWEAEKVYFLNTKNGIEALEILVSNLVDYLKIHHFNTVPLWRNPKAMDEERNFNRLAQNDDLMKPLDKNKGKRHYFIETQNLEKKNKLVREEI